MKRRRQVLAGLGTAGLVSLAGCSGLPFVGDEGRTHPDFEVPLDAFPALEWPSSPFPVAVPDALAETHRERAQELLDTVPTDPQIPNGAIAEELRSDRERVASDLADGPTDPWPLDTLSSWRGRRGSAANVAATYRAATGDDDDSALGERRRLVREDLGSFSADHDYRADSVREGVLVHAPIENMLSSARRRVRPDPLYPDDPVATPFRAGDAFEGVERAGALCSDMRRLRETYLDARSGVRSQWNRLIAASDRLRFAVAETREPVDAFLDAGREAFDRDLDGTAAYTLFETASQEARWADDTFAQQRDDGAYATSVVDAGEALAAIETLRTAIEGIRDGDYQDDVTLASLERGARRARDALDGIRTAEYGSLAARIGRPALSAYDGFSYQIEEDYADPLRLQGELAWVELYARAVPAATAFVVERLDAAAND
ncbi:hypothetical protein [Halorhabdus rudnickae]|uniref:hypothetical protein n=1 Tax=Halorhabdus rudnickae TaxID=1775544 RepID=UPI001083DC62|nr:hypothetical protein [Halorhabdus rudnickae]